MKVKFAGFFIGLYQLIQQIHMRQPLHFLWLLLAGAFFLGTNSVQGQVSITAGSLTYTQNFNGLATTGSPTFTQNSTIAGIYGERTGTGTTIVADAGSGTAGGLYSYGTGTVTDRALGSLGSSNAAAGNFAYGTRFVNNTGTAITSLRIQYTGEQWRNGGSGTAAQTVSFSYLVSSVAITSTNPTPLATPLPAGYTSVSTLDFTSPVFAGTGSALDGNSAANRSAKDAVVSVSIPVGSEIMLRWHDPDHAGADHGLAIDDLTVTFTTAGPVTGPALSASPVTLSGFSTIAGTASASQSYTLTAQALTAAVTITAPTSYEVSLDNISFATTQTLPQSTTSATVFARIAASAAQGSLSGTITNVSGAQSAGVAVSGTVGAVAGTFTKISTIQGSGNTFALSGSQTIEGIVTRNFPGTSGLMGGFFVQEEDADSDGNPATSEGIFCFDATTVFPVAIGDKVRVTGTPAEFASATSTVTQLTTLTSVLKVGTEALPAVTVVTLPYATATGGVSALERFEGMLVEVKALTGNLTVTDVFGVGRFGQVGLAAMDASTNQPGTDARIDQYTQFNAPSISGNTAYQAAVQLRQIILDDANTTQNPATVIHARGGNALSASNTIRGGDDVLSIIGIMDERFEGYRIQTSTGVNFNATNPRPTGTPNVGGTLKAGFANVLNYFNGPTFPTSRGADNAAEFTRQRDKVIANLLGMGADIIGLGEVENDGYGASSAIQDLVNGLNAVAGANTYTFLNAGTASSDEITVAFVYKPASVSLVGAPAVLSTGAFATVGRGAIAQTFQQRTGGGIMTVVANHWKSKGSVSAGTGNTDTGDGQGQSNGIRTLQAQELAAWLATKPTGTQDPDYLIVGDLNAYAEEQPLTTMAAAGYPSLLPNTTYSYQFNGDWGSLDHALGNSTLAAQMTSAVKLHTNADEPIILDYNTEFKSAGQITSYYANDQYRASDHDPVVVGLNLTTSALPVQLIDFRAAVMGDKVSLAWETAVEQNVSHFLVERSTDAREFGAVGRVLATGNSQTRNAYGLLDEQPLAGTSYYRLRTIDLDGSSTTSKLVAVIIDDVRPEMTLMGNPVADNQIQLAVRNMGGATYSLRSLTGQTIRTQTLQQTDRTVKLQLNQPMPAGVYLLEGRLNNNRKVVKVLID